MDPSNPEIWKLIPTYFEEKRRHLPLQHLLGSAERLHPETIELLHHRGSRINTAKLLSKNANPKASKVTRSRVEVLESGDIDLGIETGWLSASSMKEIRQAVNNLIAALRHIHQFDYSALVISNVMTRMQDFAWTGDQVRIATEFLDHMLEVSSNHSYV